MKFKVRRIATAYIEYNRVVEADNDEQAMEIAEKEMEHMHNWNIDEITDWHDYEVSEV